jgi:hypothetical protein
MIGSGRAFPLMEYVLADAERFRDLADRLPVANHHQGLLFELLVILASDGFALLD